MSKIVYHYCSVEIFHSIISNSILRFGNIVHMNDGLEGIWFAKMISENCDKYTEDWQENDKSKEIKRFIKNDMFEVLKEIRENSERSKYVCCFSKESDLLSQWRAYGQDGYGVSLGIDIKKLKDSKCHQIHMNDGRKYSATLKYPDNILYNEEETGDVIYLNANNTIGKKYIKEVFDRIKNNLDKGMDINNIKIGIAVDIKDMIIFKNIYFREEKEYRIECNPELLYDERNRKLFYSEVFEEYNSKIIIEGPFHQVVNNKIKEYFNVDFSIIKDDVIKEIYLGPKCLLSEKNILKILKSNGYKNVDKIKIIKSEGSYV